MMVAGLLFGFTPPADDAGGSMPSHQPMTLEQLLRMDASQHIEALMMPTSDLAFNADRGAIQLKSPCGGHIVASIQSTAAVSRTGGRRSSLCELDLRAEAG